MNIEIVWLAYDPKMVTHAWSGMTVRELYEYILNDEYRKRVDPRSMLFHSKQSYVLTELETLMKKGAIDVSIEKYLSSTFYHGDEEFPLECGELFFDLSLISYFTSLRMADDYHLVERFFDRLFKKMGIVRANQNFSFFELGDLDKFSENLKEIKVQHILEVVESDNSLEKDPDTYVRLVQNYIEFFNYYRNNNLCPFYYNSETDIKKWGDLVERQNERSLNIVNMAYKKVKEVIARSSKKMERVVQKGDVLSRLREKRRLENLVAGLGDADPLIRQKAAEYLGAFKDKENVPFLIKGLTDKESEVRQESARALGEIGDDSAVGPLVDRILNDDSPNVVTSSAQALSKIGSRDALLAIIDAFKKGMYQLAVPIAFYPDLSSNKKAIARLFEIGQGSVDLKRQVAFILGALRSKDSVKKLSEYLEDKDREVVVNSIYSLGRIGSRDALAPLKEMARSSKDEEIRRISERAMNYSG